MRRLAILVTCALLAICSCSKEKTDKKIYTETDEKIYTEEELGVIVEWRYGGRDEVYNETDGTVILTTFYPEGFDDRSLTFEIGKGKWQELKMGCYDYGYSLEECVKARIKLSDGTEFECVPGGGPKDEWENAWSRRFFKNYEQENEYEVVDCEGKKLRHDLIVRIYHIDNTLVDLWKAGQ